MLFALTHLWCVVIGITSNIKVFDVKNKSIKKILNNKGLRIDLCDPKLFSYQLL